ncbi:hypothetical protein GCM10027168_03280 [Streptomyces capparidis]
MAFSADELRVVRRALAEALHPTPTFAPRHAAPDDPDPDARPGDADRLTTPAHPVRGPDWAEGIQEYVRLAEALEEAVREGGRQRAFMLADLRRYRAALPGTAAGYLERLGEALDGGYLPVPDDLAALRSLRALPCGPEERARRTALLARCQLLAEREVRARLSPPRRRGPAPVPVPAARLLGGIGGSRALEVLVPRAAGEQDQGDERRRGGQDERGRPRPSAPSPDPQGPRHRTPTPAEIWPPRRRPEPAPARPPAPARQEPEKQTPDPGPRRPPEQPAPGERETPAPPPEPPGGSGPGDPDGPAPERSAD